MVRADKAPGSKLSGILAVDKPSGMTSMDVVAIVRRKAGGARTGHAGTLDPLATGVLVLGLGRATRYLSRFMATEKRYRTVIELGAFTTTDDREGRRLAVEVATPPLEATVRAQLAGMTGTVMQRPPAHSAIKIGGRRAYQRTRRGETVEIPPRPVVIHAIELIRYDWPELEIDVRCAKGTYIRSLARDIGHALDTGGHCATLRRTAVGPFDESRATPVDALPEKIGADDLMPLESALELL